MFAIANHFMGQNCQHLFYAKNKFGYYLKTMFYEDIVYISYRTYIKT